MRLLEQSHDERFAEERDRLVHILEAGFVEREKMAVANKEKKLTDLHEAELEKLRLDFQAQVEREVERAK